MMRAHRFVAALLLAASFVAPVYAPNPASIIAQVSGSGTAVGLMMNDVNVQLKSA